MKAWFIDGLFPALAWGAAVRGNYQPVLLYVQFNGIAEAALLNERFRNADPPGISDAHQFDSHKVLPTVYQ